MVVEEQAKPARLHHSTQQMHCQPRLTLACLLRGLPGGLVHASALAGQCLAGCCCCLGLVCARVDGSETCLRRGGGWGVLTECCDCC